ncbi:MAG: hypothetical protein M1833_001514 [Piccolia ochrophora]|nr:MAG: hypothetical protein M1833_001514 [Piccolia ochrophora]
MNPSMGLSAPRLKPRKVEAPHLSTLPRFHPSKYAPSAPASHSSAHGSLTVNVGGQGYHPQYSDAQRQLHAYQRELITTATRGGRYGSSGAGDQRPLSPRLLPLGSPGPVTPLMLEEEGGYLAAGASNGDAHSLLREDGHKELVERLIREEKKRRRDSQGERTKNNGSRRQAP